MTGSANSSSFSHSSSSAAAVVADTVIRPAKAASKEPVPNVSVPGGAIGDGADENGWLPLGFDPSVVDTLSTLYGKWTSGLRELYANMVASCKKASAEYGARPGIVITIDGRTVTLAAVDSCGMSRAVFRDGVAVAGNTGNDDPYSPGQWGLGSLSFVMLADEMLIESHSRATGERFVARALRGGRFATGGEGLPSEPDFDWYGTRMTLELRDDLDVGEAIKTAMEISEMSGVPTALRLCAIHAVKEHGGIVVNDGCGGRHNLSYMGEHKAMLEGNGDEWRRALEGRAPVGPAVESLIERYDGKRDAIVLQLGGEGMYAKLLSSVRRAGFHACVSTRSDKDDCRCRVGGVGSGGGRSPTSCPATCVDPTNQRILAAGGGIVAIHAEDENIEVAALFIASVQAYGRRWWWLRDMMQPLRAPVPRMWLAGMPIEVNEPGWLDEFHCVHVHAKNERRYRPTPDRNGLRTSRQGSSMPMSGRL